MQSLSEFQQVLYKWHLDVHPTHDRARRMDKLREEIEELEGAPDDENLIEETADCGIVVLIMAAYEGWELRDITGCISKHLNCAFYRHLVNNFTQRNLQDIWYIINDYSVTYSFDLMAAMQAKHAVNLTRDWSVR